MASRILIFLTLLFTLAGSGAAHAQRVEEIPGLQPESSNLAPLPGAPPQPNESHIAAVVNDSVISTADVRARMAMAILTSNLPDTDEVKQKLLPQVLRGLIDEQLQLQEGKRLDITVTPDEIKRALEKLSQDNNIPGGDISAFLNAHGVPASTLTAQARAALTWNKVAARELRPRVDIGDDEVDAAIERLRANAGKQEYLVSEIYLAVDNPKDEDQIRKFAENLVHQIKQGATFGAVARQFSQGTGAANGGDIGWIQAGQLAPELDKALLALNQGEISPPVRAANGFHIVGLREKRTLDIGGTKDASITLQQASLPFGNTDKATVLQEAEHLRQVATGCNGLADKIAQDFPGWRWQDLGEVKTAEAPKWLVEKTRDIAVGHASEAMATGKDALILFVCGRKAPQGIDREAILNSIGSERMELLARRQLRDLRRNAYIDLRRAATP